MLAPISLSSLSGTKPNHSALTWSDKGIQIVTSNLAPWHHINQKLAMDLTPQQGLFNRVSPFVLLLTVHGRMTHNVSQ
jgi:hypothetical protein